MRDILVAIIGVIVPIVEACGVVVILMAVARVMVLHVVNYFRRRYSDLATLRLYLGQSMVMGLEFLVAADILRTAISPEWEDILFLAALVGLRTVLNYFLERELRMIDCATSPGSFPNQSPTAREGAPEA